MTQSSFWQLCQLLEHSLEKEFSLGLGTNLKQIYQINSALCFFCSNSIFAVLSYLDIHTEHMSGRSSMYTRVWDVIHTINTCPNLDIKFPQSCRTERDREIFPGSQWS